MSNPFLCTDEEASDAYKKSLQSYAKKSNESLLHFVEKKNTNAIKNWEKRAGEGEIMRIM